MSDRRRRMRRPLLASPSRHARRRLRLRTRVIVAFAAGAALVSATLAVAAFYLVRQDLLSQRSASARRDAFVDARLVKVELAVPTANIGQALSAVTGTNGAAFYIYRHGLWYSNTASTGGTVIPAPVLAAVVKGSAVEQRATLAGTTSIVVGVPLPAANVDYFEVHPLTELQGTLGVLATVLATVAIATTVGGALLGWWASGRLSRPLGDIAAVATDIAGGSLERRLPEDPDLHPLVSSFNEMVGALQQRIERDARFASDVTHELRSPLTTIAASVEVLGAYRSRLPAEAGHVLEALRFEVTRFSTMLQDLLEISRMDAGAAPLHFGLVPLDEVVHHCLRAAGHRARVQVADGAVGVPVRGDKRRLARIVANLLENAETHAGGATGVVVGRSGDWLTLSVEDAGPGIPPEERALVFERFYRGRASGRRRAMTGTGLGLALVAEHVNAHGGTVSIEDRPGGGTRVVVHLPVAPATPAGLPPPDGRQGNGPAVPPRTLPAPLGERARSS